MLSLFIISISYLDNIDCLKIYRMRINLKYVLILILICLINPQIHAQKKSHRHHKKIIKKNKHIHQGIASYYSDEFVGKKTASGDIFNQKELTAACNILPLGTFVVVTNISNGKKLSVKINDRLSRKSKRLIDLTKEGAKQLGYINRGLAHVKIEVQKK